MRIIINKLGLIMQLLTFAIIVDADRPKRVRGCFTIVYCMLVASAPARPKHQLIGARAWCLVKKKVKGINMYVGLGVVGLCCMSYYLVDIVMVCV